MDQALLAKYDRHVPRYTSYPTANHFHAGVDAATYRAWLAETPADAALSLYVHIPYCHSMCWFCGCHTKIVRRYQPIADYLDVLRREADLVGDVMGGRGRVRHVHWGGGTPTMLRASDVGALADHLRQRFAFTADVQFAVEIDPREMTRDCVQSLAAAGVNRTSLGVQDIDPGIQRAINRIQPFDVTRRVVDWLRDSGIDDINIDLMYGLPGQTTEHVIASVDAVLTLAPQRIAIFGYAHVPWMKRHQRMIDTAALPGTDERFAQSETAARRLGEAGYVAIGLDHFAHPDDALAIAARAGRLRRNFQGYTTDDCGALIGLGASAIGALPQGYVQNAAPLHSYRDAIAAGDLATKRGIALDDGDRLRRDVIERLMCNGAVDLADVCRFHDRPVDHLAPELARLAPLAADGLIAINGKRIALRETGRPLVRAVCAGFDGYLADEGQRHVRAI